MEAEAGLARPSFNGSVARSVTWKKTTASNLLEKTLSDELHFEVEEGSRKGGVSAAVLVSVVLHILLLIYIIRYYRPVTDSDRVTPMVHYVELIRQNPEFTEAPGSKTKTAPINAPFSDANRHASSPNPTGDKPTLRPGNSGFYTPASKARAEETARARQAAAAESELSAPSLPSQQQQPTSGGGATFTYRPSQASAATGINWHSA